MFPCYTTSAKLYEYSFCNVNFEIFKALFVNSAENNRRLRLT